MKVQSFIQMSMRLKFYFWGMLVLSLFFVGCQTARPEHQEIVQVFAITGKLPQVKDEIWVNARKAQLNDAIWAHDESLFAMSYSLGIWLNVDVKERFFPHGNLTCFPCALIGAQKMYGESKEMLVLTNAFFEVSVPTLQGDYTNPNKISPVIGQIMDNSARILIKAVRSN